MHTIPIQTTHCCTENAAICSLSQDDDPDMIIGESTKAVRREKRWSKSLELSEAFDFRPIGGFISKKGEICDLPLSNLVAIDW